MFSTTIKHKLPAALLLKKTFLRPILVLVTLLFTIVLYVVTPTALAAEIEPLHGINVTERSVMILVTSTGCTQKEDFIVVLEKSQPPTVTFIRLKPDLCRAAPRPMPIKFSPEEVGATTFTMRNLFEPAPGF